MMNSTIMHQNSGSRRPGWIADRPGRVAGCAGVGVAAKDFARALEMQPSTVAQS